MNENAKSQLNYVDEFKTLFSQLIKRKGADELMKFLENSDFFTAPASTKYHLAEEGGLCKHSLNVYYRLRELCNNEPEFNGKMTTPEMEESIAVVALLHDLCKVGVYVPEFKNKKSYAQEDIDRAANWEIKKDNGGYFVWVTVPGYTTVDKLPYGHGEKSVYIASSYIKLTREEAIAIRFHMGFSGSEFKGGDSSVSKAFEMYPLAVLAHVADLEATFIDEVEGNESK